MFCGSLKVWIKVKKIAGSWRRQTTHPVVPLPAIVHPPFFLHSLAQLGPLPCLSLEDLECGGKLRCSSPPGRHIYRDALRPQTRTKAEQRNSPPRLNQGKGVFEENACFANWGQVLYCPEDCSCQFVLTVWNRHECCKLRNRGGNSLVLACSFYPTVWYRSRRRKAWGSTKDPGEGPGSGLATGSRFGNCLCSCRLFRRRVALASMSARTCDS